MNIFVLVDKMQPLIIFIILCACLIFLRLFTKISDETYEYLKKMAIISFILYVIKLMVN